MYNTDGSKSFLGRALTFGASALIGLLAYSAPIRAQEAPAPEKPVLTTEDIEREFFDNINNSEKQKDEKSNSEDEFVFDSQKPAPEAPAEKKDAGLELGLKYSHQGNSQNTSDSAGVSLKTRNDPGHLRLDLGFDHIRQDDAVHNEGIFSVDSYINNSESAGGGLGFKLGNKTAEASLAGHISNELARLSLQFLGGTRKDETESNGITNETENSYFGIGAGLKLQIDFYNALSFGVNVNNNSIDYTLTGPINLDENLNADATSAYGIYSGTASGNSAMRSGYFGVLVSSVDSNGESDSNANVIAGALFKLTPRTFVAPNLELGSRTGLGLEFIVSADAKKISEIYASLRETEATAGVNSEAYKNAMRKIELLRESISTDTVSFSGNRDNDSEAETYTARYRKTWATGASLGFGAEHTYIPGTADENSTNILFEGYVPLGNGRFGAELNIPTKDDGSKRIAISYFSLF
jgi:hypothetical protein